MVECAGDPEVGSYATLPGDEQVLVVRFRSSTSRPHRLPRAPKLLASDALSVTQSRPMTADRRSGTRDVRDRLVERIRERPFQAYTSELARAGAHRRVSGDPVALLVAARPDRIGRRGARGADPQARGGRLLVTGRSEEIWYGLVLRVPRPRRTSALVRRRQRRRRTGSRRCGGCAPRLGAAQQLRWSWTTRDRRRSSSGSDGSKPETGALRLLPGSKSLRSRVGERCSSSRMPSRSLPPWRSFSSVHSVYAAVDAG